MTTSTINPNIPVVGTPVSAPPIQGNFQAAYSDINALWAAVTAGGGTVTNVSGVNANGVAFSISNPSTTPAITISLGAIVPSTVNGLTFVAQAVGFTIAGGTTSKTLTVPNTASVSGTNTGDQTITLSGDISGTGTGPITTTLPNVNSNVGSFSAANITVNAKGQVTAASSGSSGSAITALTGDITATGPGSAAATLATVNSNVGSFTYGSFTVNAKGQITAASSGSAPPSLSGNNTWTGINNFSQSLTSGVSALTIVTTAFATNAALANTFTLTLVAGATTASAPTNPTDGQIITYELAQPSSGSAGTVTWNAIFDGGTTGLPTLSTTNSKVDIVSYRYSARLTKWLCLNGTGIGY